MIIHEYKKIRISGATSNTILYIVLSRFSYTNHGIFFAIIFLISVLGRPYQLRGSPGTTSILQPFLFYGDRIFLKYDTNFIECRTIHPRKN